jgi:ParB family chromosome partitioning protein
MGHARAIINLPEAVQKDLVNKAIDKGWSVREIEEAAQYFLVPKPLISEAKKKTVPDFDEVMLMQGVLAEKISAQVKISHRENGRGKIEISYQDMDELNRLLGLF